MQLKHAHKQWSTRPADERFLSLTAMLEHFRDLHARSRQTVVGSRDINLIATDARSLVVRGPSGADYSPTHWSFGQLAQLATAPAGYLRTLPAPMAADCINYGLRYLRETEDVGILLRRPTPDAIDSLPELSAATGPKYGRIWNMDILAELIARVGDGITGDWTVPGEFGQAIEVTTANTTLYASAHDMWVFLADERNRIEVPNRRGGQPGQLSRGFFLWNSEVGAGTAGIAAFLFDYACSNRIVWGVQQYRQISIRHTSRAPMRWADELTPQLAAYAVDNRQRIVDQIEAAQAAKVEDDKLDDFLANRFTRSLVPELRALHIADEGRPIETLWDIATAATAFARTIPHQDRRVRIERAAGAVLDMA